MFKWFKSLFGNVEEIVAPPKVETYESLTQPVGEAQEEIPLVAEPAPVVEEKVEQVEKTEVVKVRKPRVKAEPKKEETASKKVTSRKQKIIDAQKAIKKTPKPKK